MNIFLKNCFLIFLVLNINFNLLAQTNDQIIEMVNQSGFDESGWDHDFIINNKWELTYIYNRKSCLHKGEIKQGDLRQLAFDKENYLIEISIGTQDEIICNFYSDGFYIDFDFDKKIPNENYGFPHNLIDNKYLVVIIYDDEVRTMKYRKKGMFHIYRLVE